MYGTSVDLRGGSIVEAVDNYASLPLPTSVPGSYYWVRNSQGTRWIPSWLGGSYYPNGLYYSTGTVWEKMEVPYQATQSDVDTNSPDPSFVTPTTFNNATKWATKQDVLSPASSLSDGYLLASDWTSFNSKTKTQAIPLPTPVSSTLDSETDIPSWVFTVTSGKKYKIEIIGKFQTDTLTTGCKMAVRTSAAGIGTISGYAMGDVSQANVATGLKIPIYNITNTYALGSRITTTSVSNTNSDHSISMELWFDCTTTGTFFVGWASEVLGSAAVLQQPSSLFITEF